MSRPAAVRLLPSLQGRCWAATTKRATTTRAVLVFWALQIHWRRNHVKVNRLQTSEFNKGEGRGHVYRISRLMVHPSRRMYRLVDLCLAVYLTGLQQRVMDLSY